MKKLLTFVLGIFVVLVLVGCNQNSEPLTVMAPNGAPALAQLFVQDNEDYAVDIVNGADPLIAALGSGSHDFVFAPTNLGAKLYTSGIDYKFLAAVTFGNYFLVSMQEDDFTIESLEGKEIIVFGQNATSDIIIRYILEENDINATLTYVDAVSTANAEFIADNNKIIMTAEPLLSVLANSVSGFKTIDLQLEYQEITGEDSFPQAGVFGKTSLTDKQINNFLKDLEESVEKVNEDLDAAVAKAAELEYTFPEAVLRTAIPNSHLDFKSALDVKADLEEYFNIILDMNGVLIGGQLPEADFYFQP
ncbi:MqnA/MqnD/SBP family protein [Mycoplasmatota bacterium WC30]